MERGSVKWCNGSKGYGLITPDNRSEDVLRDMRKLKHQDLRA